MVLGLARLDTNLTSKDNNMTMNQLALRLICTLALFAGGLARADIVAGPITNAANGSVYYLLSSNGWNEAEAEGIALGGHLVTIESEEENTWVFNTFAAYDGVQRALWIGLTDQGH